MPSASARTSRLSRLQHAAVRVAGWFSVALALMSAAAWLSLRAPFSSPLLAAVHAGASVWLLMTACAVLLALLVRSGVAVVAASLVMVAWMSVAAGQVSSSAPAFDDARTDTLRVAAANVLMTNTRVSAAASDVAALGGDVVVVSETTPRWRSGLAAAWEGQYRLVADVPAGDGTADAVDGSDVTIWSSLRPVETGTLPFGTLQLPWATFETDAGGLTVVGVHLSAPDTVPSMQDWEVQLDALAVWMAEQDGSVVLAGDFNSSPTNPQMSSLLDVSADAASAVGRLWPATWPADRVPVLSLDHVLVSDSTSVASFGVADITGSDHHAVFADVAAGR